MPWAPFAAIVLLAVVAAGAGAALAVLVMRRRAAGALLPPGVATGPADVPTAAPATANPSAADHESFAYIVSHDLRAPIRVVEGFTKIVKEDYAGVLDRMALDHLDRVLGAAARMNHMIEALLALSRLSTRPLARLPVDLSRLAHDVVDELRRQSPERDVEVEIAPDLIATGDPTLLRMVLENLIGNAWKYTARAHPARIAFVRRGGRDGGGHDGDDESRTTFTLQDNGAGFDMRFAERLFGVFQRLHSASEFPGTGVGLASVQRIVRRHGGEVWAEAEPDHGARFHFSLPRAQAAPSA